MMPITVNPQSPSQIPSQINIFLPLTVSTCLLLMCVSHHKDWIELLSERQIFIQSTASTLFYSVLLMEELIPLLGSHSCHAEHVPTESWLKGKLPVAERLLWDGCGYYLSVLGSAFHFMCVHAKQDEASLRQLLTSNMHLSCNQGE